MVFLSPEKGGNVAKKDVYPHGMDYLDVLEAQRYAMLRRIITMGASRRISTLRPIAMQQWEILNTRIKNAGGEAVPFPSRGVRVDLDAVRYSGVPYEEEDIA